MKKSQYTLIWIAIFYFGCASSGAQKHEANNSSQPTGNSGTNETSNLSIDVQIFIKNQQFLVEKRKLEQKMTLENGHFVIKNDTKFDESLEKDIVKFYKLKSELEHLEQKKNDCNLNSNLEECHDGRWFVNASTRWNVFTPGVELTSASSAIAMGLNLQYRSRWMNFNSQISVAPLQILNASAERQIGFALLRPDVSPFSTFIEMSHTPFYLHRAGYLYGGYIPSLASAACKIFSSCEGAFSLPFYMRVGAQNIPVNLKTLRPDNMEVATYEQSSEKYVATIIAGGISMFDFKYNSKYHSSLKQQPKDKIESELEIYGSFYFPSFRLALGDASITRTYSIEGGKDSSGASQPEEKEISALGTYLGEDKNSFRSLGFEPVLGIRFGKVFFEASVFHSFGDLKLDGLSNTQMSVRVGFESELAKINEDAATPSKDIDDAITPQAEQSGAANNADEVVDTKKEKQDGSQSAREITDGVPSNEIETNTSTANPGINEGE